MYHSGRVYWNTHMPYCGMYYFPGCAGFSTQVELNNERVNNVKIPCCCPCLGPWPVLDKAEQQIGQLDPHCYMLKACSWTLCFPCCLSLDVKNQNLMEIYTVKRPICSFWCCAKWEFFNSSQQSQAEILQTGIFCPNYQITLPSNAD